MAQPLWFECDAGSAVKDAVDLYRYGRRIRPVTQARSFLLHLDANLIAVNRLCAMPDPELRSHISNLRVWRETEAFDLFKTEVDPTMVFTVYDGGDTRGLELVVFAFLTRRPEQIRLDFSERKFESRLESVVTSRLESVSGNWSVGP